MRFKRFGLIVNPIAGMGGAVGLRGTDGAITLAKAVELGAVPLALERTKRALIRLAVAKNPLEILTCPGPMGAEAVEACGLRPKLLSMSAGESGGTTAVDTRDAASEMKRFGIDLLAFAGGDGTARDVQSVVGESVPILGIPAGVKMHSGVFASSPASAGNLLAAIASNPSVSIRLGEAEIVDLDEEALREGRVCTRLYGYARVPVEQHLMRGPKSRSTASDETRLDAMCADLIRNMVAGRLYIVGPGRTAKRILERLGITGTLLGVDAVRDGKLIGLDLNEHQLLNLIDDRPATIIVGVVGGQGYLFGRGNQQISARVIRRVQPQNVLVISGIEKLLALQPSALRVDTGDEELDRLFAGFAKVHVAAGQSVMLRVIA